MTITFTDIQIMTMTKEQAENEIPFGHLAECGCATFSLWMSNGNHYRKTCPNYFLNS